MAKNYLLIYSEQLATDIELLCDFLKFCTSLEAKHDKEEREFISNRCTGLYCEDQAKTKFNKNMKS